ncbi:MAG: hypothetical protein II198_02810, partial [Bacteroidaceae bacterium]|nr:hypothetical protein [Bacteroidaceae bacterium]
MKRLFNTLILFFLLLPAVSAGGYVPDSKLVYKVGDYRHKGNSSPKYEYRAVWLTTIENLDWPRTQVKTSADIEKQKA